MESLLQIDNVTKSFGDRILFNNITFGINVGDKVGIIAKNGTGKSTLMKIICGEEPYDSGNVIFRNDIKVGFLHQQPILNADSSIIDACINGKDEMSKAIVAYERAVTESDGDKLSKAILMMDTANAWDYEDRFKQILSQFKITDVNQKIGTLSGGQQKRIALAKIIIDNPDLLILDEPTNHLDIEMIEWLESFLSRSRIAILMVTHDRYFLDRVCNKIIEIDQETIFTYNGNYNYFLEKRNERIETQNAEVERARNLYRTELDWMRRQPQARASKAKYRIDAFYELEKKTQVSNNDKNIDLRMKSSYIGSKIFESDGISKKYGDKVILDDFNYVFARYEKLGIVGNNGVGKSTFIKLLLGLENPDSGHFDIGETVNFGYYNQEGIEFDESKKVIDAVKDVAEVITFDEKNKYTASQFLQLFLFSASDQQKFIYKLSGGEKKRLYLTLVLIKKPNFLILDEPTNDLDIVTLEILEDYLSRFKGCLIVISHDRFFMDKTIDHLFVFEGNGKIKDFPGSYTDYRVWKDEIEAQRPKEFEAQKVKKPVIKAEKSGKITYKERLELESLTKEIDELTQEKKSLDEFFESGNTEDIQSKSERYEVLNSILDEKEFRWLELSEKDDK